MLEKMNAWRRLVLEVDPRVTSRAAGLTQMLLAFKITSDTASFELFDRECLKLKQVTSIDIQDEVKPLDHAREQAKAKVEASSRKLRRIKMTPRRWQKNRDMQCSCCQRKGHVKSDCRVQPAELEEGDRLR